MKKGVRNLLSMVLAVCLLAGSVTSVWAKEDSQARGTQIFAAGTALTAADGLAIDNLHIYPGMTEAYQNGYTPEIAAGNARVVVPFVWKGDGTIDGNQITVTLEFPGNSGQVFLGTNYRKSISEQSLTVGLETCRVYLLDVPLEVKAGSPAGTYPITVKTAYRVDHQSQTQECLIYITLKESGTPQKPTESSPSEPSSEPVGTEPGSESPDAPENGDSSGAAEDPDHTSDPADPTEPIDPTAADPTLSTEDLSGEGSGSDDGGYSGGGYTGGGTAETKPDAMPRLLVASCEVSPGEYRAGDRVDVRLSIYNTSSQKKLRNIRLTYTSGTGEVTPVDAAPDFYLSQLGKGESFETILRLKIADGALSSSQPISLSMDFEDSDGNSYSGTETIYLNLTQDVDFRLDTPVIPLTMEAMTSQEITLNLFNVGTAKVKNVICQVEMEGVIPKGSTYVGDVGPNATEQAVIGIVVGDLTYTYPEQEEKYGKIKGSITVTYEDEQGNAYEQTVALSSEIVKPEGVVDETEPVEYESQWWVSIVTGLILIQALILLVFLQKKKHRC